MAKLISNPKKASAETDELMSTTQRVWEQIRENPSRTATIAGSIVAVVVIILLGTYLKERAEENRVTAVAQVVDRYVAEGGEERSAMLDELQGLAEKHARTAPGGQALYFLGGLQAEQGDYSAAVETYRRVGKDHADNRTLAAAADLARGYTHIQLDEFDEARQVFSGLLDRGDVPVPRTQIEMEIGALYEREGKHDEAAAAFRRLVESDPEGPWGIEAAARLRILEGA